MISEVKIITQINQLKFKMEKLWDEKGKTNPEILEVSIEIDQLLNQYYRLKLDLRN